MQFNPTTTERLAGLEFVDRESQLDIPPPKMVVVHVRKMNEYTCLINSGSHTPSRWRILQSKSSWAILCTPMNKALRKTKFKIIAAQVIPRGETYNRSWPLLIRSRPMTSFLPWKPSFHILQCIWGNGVEKSGGRWTRTNSISRTKFPHDSMDVPMQRQ